jgi:tetratricopeptide (TPR) repeat protein
LALSKPALAQGRLDGPYVGTETYYTLARTNFNTIYYLFFSDGRVYRGLPKGGALREFDFARAQQNEPDKCGHYLITGSSIRFEWVGNRQSKTESFARSADGVVIGGTDFSRIRSFNGLKLDGAYTRTGNAQFNAYDPSAGGVVSERTIAFRPNGTFSTASSVGARTRESGVRQGSSGAGQYRIAGNVLEMAYGETRRERFTFYVDPESAGEARPRHIVIDGLNFLLDEGSTSPEESRTASDDSSATSEEESSAESESPVTERRRSPDTTDAEALRQEGNKLGEAGNWAAAEEKYREAIRLEPGVARFHGALALALLAQERYAESLAASRKALRIGPPQAWMHDLAASAWSGQERFDSSEVEERAAIRMDPSDADYHASLGYVLFRQARYLESLTESRAALKLNPKSAMAHDNAGDALLHLGQLQPSEDEFREAIQLDPDTPEYHYDLARVLAEEGKRSQAIQEAYLAHVAEPANTRYLELYRKLQKP